MYDKFDDPNYNPFETKTKIAPENLDEKFADPDFNPFETKSKMESADPYDDPNFNPFQTKSKIGNEDFNPYATITKKRNVSTRDVIEQKLNSSNDSDRFYSDEENQVIDENHDPNGTKNATYVESASRTLVEHVTGEKMRYTDKDMDVIRNHAKLSGDDVTEELAKMRLVCDSYLETFNTLEKLQKETLATKDMQITLAVDDRDALEDDIKSMDKSFNDLQARFSRMRTVCESMRKNEGVLKNSIKTREDRLRDEQSRYQTLLKSSNDLVQRANEEYSQVEANSKKEILSLQAEIRMLKVQNESLEHQLERKESENKELTQICDELIANVQR